MSNKKQKEEESLKEAFSFARKKVGRTHRIMQQLDGELIERHDAERPDFILRVKPTSKHDSGSIVGIEHFVVDHYSFRNRQGVLESASKKDLGLYRGITNKYRNLGNASEQQIDNAVTEFTEVICKSLVSKIQSGYKSLVEAFRYTMDLHLEKIAEYRKNLGRYVKKEKSVLCFYIEVISDFNEFLFVTGDKVKRYKPGYFPLFQEIVSMLETLKEKGVEYVIIAMRVPITEKLVDVIALPTTNIRQECQRQNIVIYHYAARDRWLGEKYSEIKDANVERTIKKTDGQYHAQFTFKACGLNPDIMRKLIDKSVCFVCWVKSRNESYAADVVVQAFVETEAPYIVEWEQGSGENSWMVTPKYSGNLPSKEVLMANFERLNHQYGFTEAEENE